MESKPVSIFGFNGQASVGGFKKIKGVCVSVNTVTRREAELMTVLLGW